MAWVPEGGSIPQPDVPFRQSTAAPRKLAAIVRVSNELLNDSQLAAVLGELFASSFAAELDKHALTGSGLGQPLGVLQSPATITVSRATANQINPADVASMVARQLPQNVQLGLPTPRGGAPMSVCWVAHPSTIRQLMLNDANKNTLYALTNSGYVLKASEHLPQLGTTGDLVLVDWSKYVYAYRERFRIAVSDQPHFDTYESLFRITARLDGAPWLDAPITADDGYQYSPFVALA
jgi:HK97 family phage major capsid protein